jgi:hypothetical protein
MTFSGRHRRTLLQLNSEVDQGFQEKSLKNQLEEGLETILGWKVFLVMIN